MKLIFVAGAIEGSRFAVKKDITLGRGPSNDVVVPDPSVSVVHCQIYEVANRFFVKDLGSTNGTRLNGERIVADELRDGDIISLGSHDIRIEFPEQQPGRQTSGATEMAIEPTVPSLTEADTTAAATAVTRKVPGGTPGADELSGNIFGKLTYYLKRKIADGGMGSIYEAEQLGAEGFIKRVAIKTILPSYARNDDFVSSFVGEAKLVANLVHQNIVQIHQLGRHGEGYYIAMEYIDGINLTEFMARHHDRRKTVPLDIATFIVSRICRGLEYAHNKRDTDGRPLGLVHRDVSPNNIMITDEGEVKLTDFGVAKAERFMADDDGYLVGSPEYMSPEQARCAPVDGRSDLYSLGLVYYELLTGIRVFLSTDDDIDKAVQRILTETIPSPRRHRPEIPENVESIVMKAVARDPDRRFQTASDLGYTLENEMYSKGYGPTIVVLAKYIRENLT